MTSVESKIGKITETSGKVFQFLSDFRNLTKIIPADKVRNWQADESSCHFTIDGLGDAGMKIVEKERPKMIKITGDGPYSIPFHFWIQITDHGEDESRIRLTLRAEISPVLKMMVQQPMKQALDVLIDHLEKQDYSLS